MENLSLKCTGMQFNVFFDPVMDIRDVAIRLEGEFKNIISAGLTFLPEGGGIVPLDEPRVLGTDVDGKYHISLSPAVAHIEQIKVDTETDFLELIEDFKSKCFDFYSTVSKITNEIVFCGITMRVEFSPEDDVLEYMKRNFVKINSSNQLYDLGVKYTFVEQDKYYVNLTISNLRDRTLKLTGIGLEIDINDRYRANVHNSGQLTYDRYSASDVLEALTSIAKDIVNNKVENLLKNGEY